MLRSALLFALSALLPLAAQDLPAPGEGAYAWDTLGDQPADARDLIFTDDGTALAFTADMYRYDSASDTWTFTDLPNPPRGPDTVLALRGDTLIAGRLLSRSFDGGASWQRVCLSESGQTVCDYLAQQTSHGIAEISVGPYAGRLLAGGRLYSDDRGASWTTGTVSGVDDGDFAMHAFAPLPSGRVLAAGWWGIGVSDDGGETWTVTDVFQTFGIAGRAIEPWATPGSVQAHDAGGPAPSCGLADTSLCEGAVMIGADDDSAPDNQAWWTNDGGRTWTRGAQLAQVYDGVAWNLAGYLGELDRDGTAEDGSSGVGRGLTVLGRGFVYATVDGGVTWQPAARAPLMEPNLSARSVRSAEVGPDGRLYVGEFYNGPEQGHVWVTAEPASAAFAYVTAGETTEARETLGVRVVPNPSAGGAVRVELSVAEAAEVQAYVVDALGRRVADLHAGPVAGTRVVDLDTSGWAAGVYSVVVEAGGARRVEAFTVVR